MKIPYSSWELRLALMNLSTDKFSEEKINELVNEFPVPPEGKSGLNNAIAEYHGISVEKLTDGPNYKVLRQEYEEHIIQQLVKKLVEKISITDKEAWALIAIGLGWLK